MAPRRKQAWFGWGSPMHRVAGWDFDHRLNGYITTAADKFSCDCGQEFPTPSGYRKCGGCGRAWNSYVIGSDGHGKEASLEKVIVREIPVRKDVIVASKRRRNSGKHDSPFQDMYDQHHIHEDAISHPIPELEPSTYPQQPPRMRREPGQASGEGRHRKQWDPDREQDPFDPRLVGASRRRAKGKCECWEGYERVPGTKPCAKGSCRKCDGHRNAMRYVAWCRRVDRMPNTRGFRRFLTAERIVRSADRHNLRRRDLKELESEEYDPEDNVTIEHFSSRRQAELFDITEEGDTPKGKGKKSNTPTMRKNPANWTGHKQNGQFTKRWN